MRKLREQIRYLMARHNSPFHLLEEEKDQFRNILITPCIKVFVTLWNLDKMYWNLIGLHVLSGARGGAVG